MDLQKKIRNLDEGLTIYSQLLKDEETILIPFAFSQYVTVCRIDELLPEYLADLERNECKEPLCINTDEMLSEDYWLGKIAKLKSDMETLGTVPMKEHGFDCIILGFKPETTTDLYRAIKEKIIQMVAMLQEVYRRLAAAPITLFGNFYLNQRAQYNGEQVVKDYRKWKRSSGMMTVNKLKTFQAEVIAWFVNGDTLKLAPKPSSNEWDDADVEQFKKQLPRSYQEDGWFEPWFDDCYTIFIRTVSWKGNILVPNYNCAGLFIFQHWDELTEAERRSFYELDMMLELINQELENFDSNPEDAKALLPAVLSTPEAMVLWQKAMSKGWVDKRYQPKLSLTKSAVLAFEMANRLGIQDRWKIFEQFWNRKNMRSNYNNALLQRQSLKFQDEVKALFSGTLR